MKNNDNDINLKVNVDTEELKNMKNLYNNKSF